MRPLAALKGDLEVSKTLGDIVDVLKTAAIIQFRSFQAKEKSNQAFFSELQDSINFLLAKKISHSYLVERPGLATCILVITSDEGFLGELNTLLINNAIDQRKSKNDEIIVLGERGARYLEDVNQSFISYPGISDHIDYTEIKKIKDYLLGVYRKKFRRIMVVYPEFISLSMQKVTITQLLPMESVTQDKEKIKRYRGVLKDELLIEPNPRAVLEVAIELSMLFKLQEIFLSAKQAEFAARITHLEGSTQELGVMKQRLSFEYFRQVHAAKDKVIREISASNILLNKG